MGRTPKQTFHQRRYTDDKQAHNQMCNNTIRKRKIKTEIRLSPHTSQNDHQSKSLQTVNAKEGVEKKEPSYTVDGNVSLCNYYGEQHGNALKN